MAIHVYAYAPSDSDREKTAREEKLFCDNLQILLEHAQDIVTNSEYFFCPLSFAWCSLLYLNGSGPLSLGQLLLGWHDGILLEPCPDCGGKVLVTTYGGSILSGSNGWSGFCVACCGKKSRRDSVHKPFSKRANFSSAVRKKFPETTSRWEEYDGQAFSWGGNGLQPARKERLVVEKTYESTGETMTLEALLQELKSGNIRKGNPPPCELTT